MSRSAANLVEAELMFPVPPMKSTFMMPPKAMTRQANPNYIGGGCHLTFPLVRKPLLA
jgi:hypothetical protein